MNQAVLNSKVEQVNIIKDKFAQSQSSVVVEYRGLKVSEITELRRALREEGVELKVYKNSLATRAAEDCGYNELSEQLKGPNAIAFGSDAVAPSRVLAKFAKKHKALVIKGGVVEGKVVDINVINELSTLPGRDGMLSMLLSCIQSPVRKFACAVKAVKEAKEGNETGAEAPAAE